METKIYHCENPEENPLPIWLKKSMAPKQAPIAQDPVAQFKQNPDAFFPAFVESKR